MHPFSKLLGIDPRMMRRPDDVILEEMIRRVKPNPNKDKLIQAPAQPSEGLGYKDGFLNKNAVNKLNEIKAGLEPQNMLYEYDGKIYDLQNMQIDEFTPMEVLKARGQAVHLPYKQARMQLEGMQKERPMPNNHYYKPNNHIYNPDLAQNQIGEFVPNAPKERSLDLEALMRPSVELLRGDGILPDPSIRHLKSVRGW